MDRTQLADFLRTRRNALRPEDVGLASGTRRRTPGLRREEVAALSGISVDYYNRIEQQRGPVPSEQVLAALARGLRLTLEERDHLFHLAGRRVAGRVARTDHVNAGLMRVFDRLQDTPAQVVNTLGETLIQTPPAVALLGDETAFTGPARSRVFRWFTDPATRRTAPPEDHARHGRALVAGLAAAAAEGGPRSPAAALVATLRAESAEFREIWDEHPVAGPYCAPKRFLHTDVGELELYGQTLLDPDQSQSLMVFTAEPGSVSDERLRLLSVLGPFAPRTAPSNG
ncbi:helix-turn-helix transcriptional regulator [Leifsonia sp. F6_8S_P_1B]|uniref:Helix-turn-helix transcriptional regulator n=1 Tax=Leifsonia williamsii TaxID=3035919 RepID=A0ABT8KEI7_9MICO|nr:helix-turn-helix transcriptional regulator [Leifsonia williamsii]MDN4615866.1 helix-turn-helix transcriptional regulator [Leifsonia williamsii]